MNITGIVAIVLAATTTGAVAFQLALALGARRVGDAGLEPGGGARLN